MCDNLFVDVNDVISVQAESAARTESLQQCAAAGCQAIYTYSLQLQCNSGILCTMQDCPMS